MTLDEAIREYHEDGYEVTHVVESLCSGCGGRTFEVQMTDEQAVRRTCLGCGLKEFIADSDEFWDDDDAEECACTCGGEEFAAALGLSCRPDGEVRWGDRRPAVSRVRPVRRLRGLEDRLQPQRSPAHAGLNASSVVTAPAVRPGAVWFSQ
ncbi:hypothetical protein [Lentzea sp.]|uniref:hypothetical protein n=1 Tax=Lentzea sp. TaxID=56099 RepID=UPI002BB21E06|nr:hypothetical protein [Lentzea sp.]HUQ56139.1 hypothetical protein [Lentzea sp.]